MIHTNLNSQTLNAVLTFIECLENVVFWIRSANYKDQLYVSKSYELIWQRSCESLFNSPLDWNSTLLQEDFERNKKLFDARKHNPGSYHLAYRIHCPDGKIQYLKDTSVTMSDIYNMPLLICGVSELVSVEAWERIYNNETNESKNLLVNNFYEILQKEFQLAILNKNQNKEIDNGFKQKNSHIVIEGKKISITSRQKECLDYLLSGKSAKETAYLMHLSTRTVESYLNTLREKFSCRTKIALVSKIRDLLPLF